VIAFDRPDTGRRPYLGYRDADGETPFGKYFDDRMAPLAPHVTEALAIGPQSPELLGDVSSAPSLLEEGHQQIETGYVLSADGGVRVAVRTPMPGVTAEMWDWWFGWHGSDSRRYKLWHPRAHLYAEWADGPDEGRRGRERYVGRTSFVDEYLGSTLAKAAIQFVPPSRLQIDETVIPAGGGRTMICARLGSSQFPVDVGYLLHDVRALEGGSEMRSRFWLGGRHVRPRAGASALGTATSRLGGVLFRQGAPAAAALLVHCAQEMAHLASFLAPLHDELGRGEAGGDEPG
jgi:hypothetical protein